MYRWLRIAIDSIAVATGFLMGSVPGVGTVILAFFTCPLYVYF